MSVTTIFSNQTANGSSSTFGTNGRSFLKISGTFNSCSIQLESKLTGSSIDFTSTGDTPFTSASLYAIPYSPGVQYRLTLSSAGASTSINAQITN